VLPSSYVQIVDNNDENVVDDNKAPPPQQQQLQSATTATACPDEDCPYALPHQLQQRPSSSLERRQHYPESFSMKTTGSQSTLNTICSHHSGRKIHQHQQQQQQPTAFYNRLYNSDPNTNMIGTSHDSHVTDDSEYLSNYAHIKHSHRHPHYHLRRQSQPDDPRLMSRNSSLKSYTSQCYINPEYFYEIRPSRSCDDSKASLISRKPSQIMLLNSELHMLEHGLNGEHSHSYPKINYLEKHYTLNDAPVQAEQDRTTSTSTSEENSDASEFHENKTSTLEKKLKKMGERPLPVMFSETDSYSTVNDEITQLVSKHLSHSIKQLVARRFIDIESYAFPLRRRHSCDSSELSDIVIPDLFSSPSRIKWNFLTGLPDHSRSQSQIYSSDYKTDEDDEEDDDDDDEDETCDVEENQDECKIDEILRRKSTSLDTRYHSHQCETETVSIWRTNSYGRARDDCNAIIFHHDNELVENCCETHFRSSQQQQQQQQHLHQQHEHHHHDSKECHHAMKEDDSTVYEFEMCTKENCEYLSKSQAQGMEEQQQQQQQHKNLLNNEMPKSRSNNKNINLKHNKFKMKKSKSSKKATAGGAQKENREQTDFLMWNKINLNNLMKKDSCNINSVNLKPHSSSSSSNSINNNQVGNNHRNLKRHQKACDKLFSSMLTQRQQQSLHVTSLILASSNSTQARIRNDGGIYFSNPDLSTIPADLRRSMNFINTTFSGDVPGTSNNITTTTTTTTTTNNNSCQFINNDLRSNVNNRSRFDSRFNNLNSATNYLLESINSNNIDNSNNSEIMQQQDLRRRLRYINLQSIVRRAQRRAKKYLNSLSFASRK
jgi:hypothetical protein